MSGDRSRECVLRVCVEVDLTTPAAIAVRTSSGDEPLLPCKT
jgi:hypothetical protein